MMEDYIVRATAADGQIRAFAANTRGVWRRQGRRIIPALWRRRRWDVF